VAVAQAVFVPLCKKVSNAVLSDDTLGLLWSGLIAGFGVLLRSRFGIAKPIGNATRYSIPKGFLERGESIGTTAIPMSLCGIESRFSAVSCFIVSRDCCHALNEVFDALRRPVGASQEAAQ
jgi:hypothetical protein